MRYTFAEGTDNVVLSTFALDSVSGVIELIQQPNFESQPVYDFTVFAEDISDSPLNATVAVRLVDHSRFVQSCVTNVPSHVCSVVVLDTNEFAPVFHNLPYEATVLEEQNPPILVFTVRWSI